MKTTFLKPHLASLCLALSLVLAPAAAQSRTGDDVYDPFADYSEFEFGGQEEADINFFRHGRFVTIGGSLGYRIFTETLGEIYDPGINYGMFFNYFFDMRVALNIYFTTGQSNLTVVALDGTRVSGNVSIMQLGLGARYYISPQNLTRGLAQLNPYLLGGFSSNTRTANVRGESRFGRDSATGLDLGAGIEISLMRNKSFIGFQGTYHMVTFPDSNTEILLTGAQPTGIFPRGDFFNLSATLGTSF